jgi:uncharacterized protein
MPTKTKTEYRSLSAELRAEAEGDEMAIAGYAALFNQNSKNLGGFKERIAPGAFTRSLKGGEDVKCLLNHDSSHLLGRTKNGTLTLSQDERGLKFRCVLNAESGAHRDLHALIKNGTLDECSFAFTVNGPNGDSFDEAIDENGVRYQRRTLKDVNLLDVSAVTYPAYNNTSVGARSAQSDYADSSSAWLASKQKFLANLTEQIEREALCESILDRVMNVRTAEQRAEADRELQERMNVAAGRATR